MKASRMAASLLASLILIVVVTPATAAARTYSSGSDGYYIHQSFTIDYNQTDCGLYPGAYQIYGWDATWTRTSTRIEMTNAMVNVAAAGSLCPSGADAMTLGKRTFYPKFGNNSSTTWTMRWYDWPYVVPQQMLAMGGFLEGNYQYGATGTRTLCDTLSFTNSSGGWRCP